MPKKFIMNEKPNPVLIPQGYLWFLEDGFFGMRWTRKYCAFPVPSRLTYYKGPQFMDRPLNFFSLDFNSQVKDDISDPDRV